MLPHTSHKDVGRKAAKVIAGVPLTAADWSSRVGEIAWSNYKMTSSPNHKTPAPMHHCTPVFSASDHKSVMGQRCLDSGECSLLKWSCTYKDRFSRVESTLCLNLSTTCRTPWLPQQLMRPRRPPQQLISNSSLHSTPAGMAHLLYFLLTSSLLSSMASGFDGVSLRRYQIAGTINNKKSSSL